MEVTSSSLKKLIAAIPPPLHPKKPGGHKRPNHLIPMDFLEMVSVYGPGAFGVPGSSIIWLLHPFELGSDKMEREILETFRTMKVGTEAGMRPYGVFPENPGLIPWATADSRKVYFWNATGEDPMTWPVVIWYDADFYECEMSATEFVQQLLGGEIDSDFLGVPSGELNAQSVSFDPRLLPYSYIQQ